MNAARFLWRFAWSGFVERVWQIPVLLSTVAWAAGVWAIMFWLGAAQQRLAAVSYAQETADTMITEAWDFIFSLIYSLGILSTVIALFSMPLAVKVLTYRMSAVLSVARMMGLSRTRVTVLMLACQAGHCAMGVGLGVISWWIVSPVWQVVSIGGVGWDPALMRHMPGGWALLFMVIAAVGVTVLSIVGVWPSLTNPYAPMAFRRLQPRRAWLAVCMVGWTGVSVKQIFAHLDRYGWAGFPIPETRTMMFAFILLAVGFLLPWLIRSIAWLVAGAASSSVIQLAARGVQHRHFTIANHVLLSTVAMAFVMVSGFRMLQGMLGASEQEAGNFWAVQDWQGFFGLMMVVLPGVMLIIALYAALDRQLAVLTTRRRDETLVYLGAGDYLPTIRRLESGGPVGVAVAVIVGLYLLRFAFRGISAGTLGASLVQCLIMIGLAAVIAAFGWLLHIGVQGLTMRTWREAQKERSTASTLGLAREA